VTARPVTLGLAAALPILLIPAALGAAGLLNPGQVLLWIAFLGSIVAALGFLAASGGREEALVPARVAFTLQWVALLGGAVFLWRILFAHEFVYQYVASYSSKAMPAHYVYAAFWGGQEGTFMLWAFLTATLGLFLMRSRGPLTTPAMFFLSLPLVMLGLVSVMRGPFLTFPAGQVPLDGNGLNPLLQDPWMTIHPPVLFTGFSSLALPFALAMAALMKRDYDGWLKPVMPWAVFSTAILSCGFIMGGVWAYKVLGWGGYWGWDPVENGSLIPWLSNIALLHGLLVQRVTGSLRRSNFFLAITSYVLVLYASFLTRSGVLADFSVHSFVNLGLNGFLLSFLFLVIIVGYGTLLFRLRDIPAPDQPLGNFSRESMMWLGQLTFMLMCVLTAVGMSAPLITKALGQPPSNVQTSYYNFVNAPLGIAMCLLLGIAPLIRWRKQEARPFLMAVLPSIAVAVVASVVGIVLGVRTPLPAGMVFATAFALASNLVVMVRGFGAGWKHGVAFLSHAGASILLLGVVASSNYGDAVQVQLPQGQPRAALGYWMTFQGMDKDAEGKDHAIIAVATVDKRTHFAAHPFMYWSEFNQGYMKKPHIERYLSHDVYISPLDLVGDDPASNAIWLRKGESLKLGQVTYRFEDFVPEMGQDRVRLTARITAELSGRTVPLQPVYEMEMGSGRTRSIGAYLPGGGEVSIAAVDRNDGGRVGLLLPGAPAGAPPGGILAVEVSTKPLINLVWVGSVLMLASAFLAMGRRILDLRRATA
jgi:cytochrome c-type biogenesis protein CcmF